jgi:hypothetical protein
MSAYNKNVDKYCLGIKQNQLEFSKANMWINSVKMLFTASLTENSNNEMHNELDRMDWEVSDLKICR